jgi:hypothetical protein
MIALYSLATDSLTEQAFIAGAFFTFLFFVPYALSRITDECTSSARHLHDWIITLFFISLIPLQYKSAGITGVAYLGLGITAAIAIYVSLLLMLLLSAGVVYCLGEVTHHATRHSSEYS